MEKRNPSHVSAILKKNIAYLDSRDTNEAALACANICMLAERIEGDSTELREAVPKLVKLVQDNTGIVQVCQSYLRHAERSEEEFNLI